MKTYVALLRGINVSGHRIIKMADLRALVADLGWEGAKTYIQSGNLVFRTASADAPALQQQLETAIANHYPFAPRVWLQPLENFQALMAACPYSPAALDPGARIYLSFFIDSASPAALSTLPPPDPSQDLFQATPAVFYLYCRSGYNQTLWHNAVLEKQLKVSATTRNWETLEKIHQLATSD